MEVTGGMIYWVATSTGLYATSQLNGTLTSWVQQGVNSIGNMVVDMIDHRSTDGLVVVATHGNGAFTAHITHVNDIVSSDEVQIPFAFTCYPNPAIESVLLEFEITSRENVSITVYDLNGTMVRKEEKGLLHGKQQHSMFRNGLKSGIYMIKVHAGKESYIRKVIFI